MTLHEFKHTMLTELGQLYPKNEIESFYKLLVHHRLNYSSVDIALNPQTDITPENLDFFRETLKELKQEKPIQYILGQTEFYSLPFKVNEHTLIPRPETEELVDWILLERKKIMSRKLTILDIGTGSGCIAISLAKHLPKATIYALDVSENALLIAKQNAHLNNVTIHFIHADILKTSSLLACIPNCPKFDIVVSNPPYVRHLEKEEMKANVLQYEPHQSLFVTNNNPLIFYDKIAKLAREGLSKEGLLFFEINQYLSVETVNLLNENNYIKIDVRKDLNDNFRMIKASL